MAFSARAEALVSLPPRQCMRARRRLSPRLLAHLPWPDRQALVAATRLLLAGVMASGATSAHADTVLVAVAANFAGTLAELGPGFTAASGHQLAIAAGSSARLATQIEAGAPFQVLLSADQATPRALAAKGLAQADTQFTYAVGRLALWSARPGRVDSQGAVLANPSIRHLAIANPKLAPYGAAAMAVLAARGLDTALAPRLVMAESVAQAYQFVATGNAELGFVALSQLMGPGKTPSGSTWIVPQTLYPLLRQDAVLLTPGRAKPAALAWLAYLKTPAALALIQSHGYGP